MTAAPPTLDAQALNHLQSWLGRSETLHDQITAAPVRALSATLDRDDPPPDTGTVLPPLWHWLYFLPSHRQSELGPDGHAMRGGFLPPVPLPRRMWAGSRLAWNHDNPLRVGDAVERVSRIAAVQHKHGRGGDLVFVQVEHELRNAHGLALAEGHDIVYRDAPNTHNTGDPAPDPMAPEPTGAEAGAAWQRELTPDDVLLFRYSALTFNGHRIHYDRRYVTELEGYPGLVVHGPLIATLLLDLLRRHLPAATVKAFRFKALRPSFDGRPLRVNGQPAPDGRTVRLWAQDADGRLTMTAEAELA